MKKKYIIGSILVVLLMLVSTQLVFINVVKSDPTIHEGNADAGDLWITECDVSTVLETIDVVCIGHTKSSDDWVSWPGGTGNVTAEWEIKMEGAQNPEFFISYTLGVYFILDGKENICLGSDYYNVTIPAGTNDYNSSGTLLVYIEFLEEQIAEGYQTLVCLLDTTVCINETDEADHFMSVAQDRCIIGVDFESPLNDPTFDDYCDEANERMPGMWFFLPGWNTAFFGSKSTMMNEQTVLIGGFEQDYTSSSQINPTWDLGDIYINYDPHNPQGSITPGANHTDWTKNSQNVARGNIKIDYNINVYPNFFPIPRPVFMGFYLYQHINGQDASVAFGNTIWTRALSPESSSVVRLGTVSSPGTGPIYMPHAKIYWYCFDQGSHSGSQTLDNTIYVNITESEDDSFSESYNWQWDGYCASQNISTQYSYGVVNGNIANLLQTDDNAVYTFAADRGYTTIDLYCSNK